MQLPDFYFYHLGTISFPCLHRRFPSCVFSEEDAGLAQYLLDDYRYRKGGPISWNDRTQGRCPTEADATRALFALDTPPIRSYFVQGDEILPSFKDGRLFFEKGVLFREEHDTQMALTLLAAQLNCAPIDLSSILEKIPDDPI